MLPYHRTPDAPCREYASQVKKCEQVSQYLYSNAIMCLPLRKHALNTLQLCELTRKRESLTRLSRNQIGYANHDKVTG